jgi:hypothetical protein
MKEIWQLQTAVASKTAFATLAFVHRLDWVLASCFLFHRYSSFLLLYKD